MLGSHFYNNTIKNTLIAFSSLFNDISVRSGNSYTKVPITFANRRKFLDRILSERELDSDGRRGSLKATFPMMSYSIENIEKDSGQPFSPFQRNLVSNGSNVTRVPYKISLNLNIVSVERDEMFQIVEQILPYFNPVFTLKMKMLDGENIEPIEKDLVFALNSVSIDDSTEGDFLEDDLVTSTLSFITGVNFYSNPNNPGNSVIKTVIFNEFEPQLDLKYTVNPYESERTDDWTLDETIESSE